MGINFDFSDRTVFITGGAQGIGAAFVSSFALGPSQRGLRYHERRLTRELGLVYRGDRTLSESARAFLDLLRAEPGKQGTRVL